MSAPGEHAYTPLGTARVKLLVQYHDERDPVAVADAHVRVREDGSVLAEDRQKTWRLVGEIRRDTAQRYLRKARSEDALARGPK